MGVNKGSISRKFRKKLRLKNKGKITKAAANDIIKAIYRDVKDEDQSGREAVKEMLQDPKIFDDIQRALENGTDLNELTDNIRNRRVSTSLAVAHGCLSVSTGCLAAAAAVPTVGSGTVAFGALSAACGISAGIYTAGAVLANNQSKENAENIWDNIRNAREERLSAVPLNA